MSNTRLYNHLSRLWQARTRGDTEGNVELIFDLAGVCTARQWRIVQGYLEWEWMLGQNEGVT